MLKQIGLKVGHWTHKKIGDPLLQILRRGAEPKQLAFSGALGVTLGIFPIVGVPVFMCGLAIAVLGSSCHAPTVFLANFIATPVELSLVIPFLRLGEAVSGGSHFALTSDALKKVLTGQASWEVLLSIFHARWTCQFSLIVLKGPTQFNTNFVGVWGREYSRQPSLCFAERLIRTRYLHSTASKLTVEPSRPFNVVGLACCYTIHPGRALCTVFTMFHIVGS